MKYDFITPKKKSSISIELTSPIGRGATAQVFKFTNESKLYAAKIYKDPKKIDWDKIIYMTEYSCKAMYSFTKKHAWPIGIIQENGTNVGFAMPLFDTSKFLSLDHFYDNILKSSVKDKNLLTLPNLGLLCKNLANVMAEFHRHKIYLIDVKPQNIAVNLENNGITFLDCDGFSIRGNNGKVFAADLISTDYIAPEVINNKLLPSKLGEKQDLYALSVLIFQILNRGLHPFSGRTIAKDSNINTNDEKAAAGLFAYGKELNNRIKPHKSSLHGFWPNNLRYSFDKTFIDGKRLTALAWGKVFSDIENKKAYARCSRYPNEASHIRFKGKKCMYCFTQTLPKVIIKKNSPYKANRSVQSKLILAKAPPNPHRSNDDTTFYWVIGIAALIMLIMIFS
jgi:DNA-binding helix-hairpin-helix protein with protein kinase domain